MERVNQKCGYCGRGVEEKDFSWDHIIPRAKGGGNAPDNLMFCCIRCNRMKHTEDLDYLRAALSLRDSTLSGVITTSQAIKMRGLGVDLSGFIDFNRKLAFEVLQ